MLLFILGTVCFLRVLLNVYVDLLSQVINLQKGFLFGKEEFTLIFLKLKFESNLLFVKLKVVFLKVEHQLLINVPNCLPRGTLTQLLLQTRDVFMIHFLYTEGFYITHFCSLLLPVLVHFR